METRPGCKVHAIVVTSCHGNDDEKIQSTLLHGARCSTHQFVNTSMFEAYPLHFPVQSFIGMNRHEQGHCGN